MLRGIWATSVDDAPLEMICLWSFARPQLSYNWEWSGFNQASIHVHISFKQEVDANWQVPFYVLNSWLHQ